MDYPNDGSAPPMNMGRIMRLVFFLVILLLIPVMTIIFGQMTRQQIKADVACKRPEIPDPRDCVGGQWKLSKDENGCIHFVCSPQK